jgi:predicted ester cyclase
MLDAERVTRDWFGKFWNEGETDVAKRWADERTVFHSLAGEPMKGLSAYMKFYEALLQAFPDIKFKIDQIVASGDTCALRWSGRATHKGNWLGRAPTGAQIEFSGMGFVKVENGKAVEAWDEWDRQAVLDRIDKAAK